MEILDYAKKGYRGGRYACVNLQMRIRWSSAYSVER